MDDELLTFNLGTEEDPKLILISEILSPSKREESLQLIHEYIDVLAGAMRHARS